MFHVEFAPRVVGEHSVTVAYRGAAVAGSPFSCKVYDVRAIKVKDVALGSVGKPITFLGKHVEDGGVLIGDPRTQWRLTYCYVHSGD